MKFIRRGIYKMVMNIISKLRVVTIGADKAKVSTVHATIQTHIAIFSPASSPRIPYFPIVLVVVLINSNHSDSVVQITRALVHDSFFVCLPIFISC